MTNSKDGLEAREEQPRTKPGGLGAVRRANGMCILLLPVFLGLALRWTGLRHGEPDRIYHPDVAKQVCMARHVYAGMFNARSVFRENIQFTLYPPGMAVLTGAVVRIYTAVAGSGGLPEAGAWRWALAMRHVGVTLFLLSSLACMATIRRKWGVKAAFWTGLMLVLEPVSAQFNHYAMNDVPLLAVLLLAWAAALRMPDERRFPRYSFVSGLAVGIAFGMKYQGILGLLFPLSVWGVLARRRPWRASFYSVLLLAAGCGIGIGLSCPLLRQDPGYFFSALPRFMSWQANILHEEISLAAKLRTNGIAVSGFLFRSGHVFLLLGAAGALGLSRGRDAAGIAALWSAFFFSGILFVAVFAARDIARANDLIPAFAFLVLVWGAAFARSGKAPGVVARRGGVWVRGFGWGLLAVFFCVSLQDSRALARVDTRRRAVEWCREHIPSRATVLSEGYTLPIDRPDLQEHRCRFLSGAAAKMTPETFQAFDYYVVSSLSYRRFFDRGSPFYAYAPARERYLRVFGACRKVAEFQDREMWFAHPVITIYRHP